MRLNFAGILQVWIKMSKLLYNWAPYVNKRQEQTAKEIKSLESRVDTEGSHSCTKEAIEHLRDQLSNYFWSSEIGRLYGCNSFMHYWLWM